MTTLARTNGTEDESALRAVLASSKTRPKRPHALNASISHAWRAMLQMKHNLVPTLVEIIVSPVLLLLMFTYLFGGAFADSPGEYLQYFLPGVLVMAVVMVTVYTGTSLNSDITKGMFDRFRTLPYWQPAAIAGNLIADLVRYFIVMSATVGFGLILGFRPDGGIVGVLAAVAVLSVFAFGVGWIFAALGVVVLRPESVSGTSMTILYPMMFVSNIFVQPETMAPWLRAVVSVNPVSHAVTATRGLIHGTATLGEIVLVLVISLALVAVFAPLTMLLYRRRNHA